MLREKRRISIRSRLGLLILAAAGNWLLGIAAVVAQQLHELRHDFETCKIIADNQSRLDCFKELLAKHPPGAGEENPSIDHWPLIRIYRRNGVPNAVAIMRTADTTQSDPDLAGLIIRCQEQPGLQLLLALVSPLPPRGTREVVLTSGTAQSTLHAEPSAAGTVLVLPIDAMAFTSGSWRGLKELGVKIKDAAADIHGVIPLDGISAAIAKLSASCTE